MRPVPPMTTIFIFLFICFSLSCFVFTLPFALAELAARVGVQRPAMGERQDRTFSPILIMDVPAIFGCDCAHLFLLCFLMCNSPEGAPARFQGNLSCHFPASVRIRAPGLALETLGRSTFSW